MAEKLNLTKKMLQKGQDHRAKIFMTMDESVKQFATPIVAPFDTITDDGLLTLNAGLFIKVTN